MKKRKKKKSIYLIFLFLLTIYLTYNYLDTKTINIEQKELVKYILNKDKTSYLVKKLSNLFIPKNFLKKTYYTNEKKKKLEKELTIIKEPIIYIYNSHQTEEYMPTSFVEYSVRPTVEMNNYILEEKFEKEGFTTYVEEERIKEILNKNNWNYAGSYLASRTLLEKRKQEHPSLKYFIDVHRDSLPKSRTTVTINEKDYATILFIVGLENKNYQENLSFTEKINNKLNEKYPSLSKGIYKKEGEGVNGVYNQDFSPRTILVEMGGPENSIEEVLNTSLAFSDCFLEVIKDEL